MSFSKKTIEDVAGDIRGLRVLIRVDWNVPGDHVGKITDDYRIQKSLDTILYLQKLGCSIVIMSHRGRPEGKPNPEFSLKPCADRLAEILGQEVKFVEDVKSEKAYRTAVLTKPGEITVVENIRFYSEEEKNEPEFAKRLSMFGEVFVQDGFGVVHRAHASTEGITHWIASFSGLLLEREVTTITAAMQAPEHPMVAIIGGAKISDKIDMVNVFLDKADVVIIGGAMANTFMKAQGKEVGKSLYEKDKVDYAKEIINGVYSAKLIVMTDAGVGVSSHLSVHAERTDKSVDEVGVDDVILDVGVGEDVKKEILQAKTTIWNGTLGYTEGDNFKKASEEVAKLMVESGARTIIGGGDTAGFVVQWDNQNGESFTHVSTGGGASLELMSGKKLPGIESLLDK